jgi:hypothetical protein
MSTRLQRSINEPIRVGLTWEERWEGPDRGLIASWERGREMQAAGERYVRKKADAGPRTLEDGDDDAEALAEAAEAARREPSAEWASRGELRPLPWRGGVAKKLKAATRPGTLQYLAMWQGLRHEDLSVDLDGGTVLTCTRTGQRVIFNRESPPEPEE